MPRQIIGTGQITITSDATQVIPENLSRAGIMITNTDTNNSVYIGNEDVLADTGEVLFPEESITIPVTNAVYAITDGPDILVTYMEIQ